MTVSTHEVRASRTATPVLVQAAEPVPGLHVYEQPQELRRCSDDATHPWRLGHHSGLPMAAFTTHDEATQAAHEVAGFADWTRTADDLRADPDFDLTGYYDRLMEKTRGLLIAGHA
ncbi:hypothetical protein F7R91_14390 [Streptomyces luteolifulvus]|uniref:Uncharacterized protein n=1 Tax=Streptomyces luteolifulvus TaxID=2615112 RepID=A0A6H9V1H7_9ACTN|nr:hypothetical protein [Streptomyces luteolifulvus]KAB1146765.1 hypothetical protein F7R91_14390 [Streptomyces luteolifulvus]